MSCRKALGRNGDLWNINSDLLKRGCTDICNKDHIWKCIVPLKDGPQSRQHGRTIWGLDSRKKVIPGCKSISITFALVNVYNQVYNGLSKVDGLRSSGRYSGWIWVCCLDLCRSLGFDLKRVQTRSELLCEGGVDVSVALD